MDVFTAQQVAEHDSVEKGLYIVVDGIVYDVSSFIDEHPGGAKVLKRVAGKDATKQFWKYHNEAVLTKYGPRFKVGHLAETAKL